MEPELGPENGPATTDRRATPLEAPYSLADSPSSCIPRLHFTLNMLGLVVIAGDEENRGGQVDAFYGLNVVESNSIDLRNNGKFLKCF